MSKREEEERDREVRRRLDQVVGTDYDAPHLRGLRAWIKARWLKWTLGVLFGVGAMLLVVYTIESHRLPKTIPPPERKAVPVQIIPAR